MEYKNIFKIVVCVMLLLSTLLFALPNTVVHLYGIPFTYICFIVPFLIGKIWFNDKFKNNYGYGYKIPIVIFVAMLQLELERFIGLADDNLRQEIQSEKKFFSLNPFEHLFDIDLIYWILMIIFRMFVYGLMIYVWLPKKECKEVIQKNEPCTFREYAREFLIVLVTLIVSGCVFWFFTLKLSRDKPSAQDTLIFLTYAFGMEFCVFFLLLSICREVRRKSYIAFGIAFVVFLMLSFLFSSYGTVIFKHFCTNIIGDVWDYREQRCRTDCIQWGQEKGCIKSVNEL